MIDGGCGRREGGAAFLCECHGLSPEPLWKTDVEKAGLQTCGASEKCCDWQRKDPGRGNGSWKAL